MANTPKYHGTPIIEDRHGKILRPITRGQQELLETMEDNDIIFVNGPAGTGKAQPLTSKILTPNGWKYMGDINVGDYVISCEGTPTKVLGVYPQGIKDIYKVTFDDNSSTECCKEHLWETKTTSQRDKRTKSYNKINVKSVEDILNTQLISKSGRKNYSIPMVKPVEFNDNILPLDSYMIGLILGDGSTRNGKVSITSVDNEIIEYCYRIGLQYGCDIYKDNISYVYKKSINGNNKNAIRLIIEELGLAEKYSHEKFIPSIYKYASIENRISVLQGLLDTDGSVDKKGTCIEYTTTSKLLCNDVKFIVQSLGGKVTISERHTSYTYKNAHETGKLSYRIIIKLPSEIIPFRLTRKSSRYIPKSKYEPSRYITDISYVGKSEAQCIYIEHPRHLYVTDDFILTHNTVIATWYGIAGIDSGKYDQLVLTRPIVEAGEELGFLPGTFEEKVAPYMQPLYEAIETVKGKRVTNEMDTKLGATAPQSSYRDKKGMLKKKPIKENTPKISHNEEFYKKVNVCPLAYLRGSTKSKSFIILDEAQNVTTTQMKLMLTRLGYGSKLIICGDINQSDLAKQSQSGFREAQELLDGVDGIGFVTLDIDDIVRHKLIRDIIIRYESKSNNKRHRNDDVYDNRGENGDHENYRDLRNYDCDDDDLDDDLAEEYNPVYDNNDEQDDVSK